MAGIRFKESDTALSTTRSISAIYLLGWSDLAVAPSNVAEAIAFIESFDESKPNSLFTRYEVGVRYSNGDEIRGQFKDKNAAITFLREMR